MVTRYDGLKVISVFSLVVYGFTVPAVFFWIVHTHRDEVKSGPYLQKYGFLTAKFDERWYGWEMWILLRKASLSIIAAHAGKTSVRCALLSMSVLFVSFGAQMAAMPFCHDDANVAEFLTITATCLILLIGLGYESINVNGEGLDGDIDLKEQLCRAHPESADCSVLWWMNFAVYFVVAITIFVTTLIVYGR